MHGRGRAQRYPRWRHCCPVNRAGAVTLVCQVPPNPSGGDAAPPNGADAASPVDSSAPDVAIDSPMNEAAADAAGDAADGGSDAGSDAADAAG